MSNFLPVGNRLHERRQPQPKGQPETDQFDSFTDSSETSEAELIEAGSEFNSDNGEESGRVFNERSTWSAKAFRRSFSPFRTNQDEARPQFRRTGTYRVTSPSPSLLADALKHARPNLPLPTSNTASSTDEFSDLGANLDTEDEATLARMQPRSAPSIGAALRSGRLTLSATPERNTAYLSNASPFRRRRGQRRDSDVGHNNGRHRRRTGVESEPEEGTMQASATFRQLFDATRDIISLSRVEIGTPRAASSLMPVLDAGLLQRPAINIASPIEDSSGMSVAADGDLPTSFTGSATSSEGTSPGNHAATPAPSNEPRGIFGWLANAIHVKVWQAFAVCSFAFAAGAVSANLFRKFNRVRTI